MLKRNRIMLHLLTIDYVSENTYTGVKISIRGHARSTWAHFMWEKYTTRLWTGWCSLNLLDANYPCSHSRTPNMCEHTVLPTPKPQNGCLRPDITIILVEKNITLSVDIFSNVSHYFFLLRKSLILLLFSVYLREYKAWSHLHVGTTIVSHRTQDD